MYMGSQIPNLKFKNVLYYNYNNNNGVSDGNSSHDHERNTANDVGLTLEKRNLGGPRKKLLVLSLGGLLVRRVHVCDDQIPIPINRLPDFVYGKQRVYKRPFCDEFLNFCLERFEVGIWSPALGCNVEIVVQAITGGLRSKLLFVWDQEKCTDTGFQSLEKAEKPIFLKELKKVWEEKSIQGKYSSSNTLLIVDTPYKALLNPPHTGIFPMKYKIENVNDTFLGPKGELQHYLNGLADADSVTSYVKEHPFGQPQ